LIKEKNLISYQKGYFTMKIKLHIVIMFMTVGLVSVVSLVENASAQIDIRLVEPTALNTTGNITGNSIDSGEDSIPSANTTAGPIGCAYEWDENGQMYCANED
jgi:hypothetical protein